MVRRVKLVNIRSHANTIVEFSNGINLVEGDVGSGKTTILQSIEAALFGYELKNMLRVGENSGQVVVEFEPPLTVGWNITTHGVRGGYIVHKDRKTDLAAVEIRNFFVKEFGLGDSPNIRAEPKLFRLAVYVRQEELKTILGGGEGVEELVRRATGVRLYSNARENATLVLRPLVGGWIQKFDERIYQLEQSVLQNKGVEEELTQAKMRLSDVLVKAEATERKYLGLYEECDSLRQSYSELENEKAKLGGELSEKEKSIERLEAQLSELNERILEDENKKLELAGAGGGLAEIGGITARELDVKIGELVDRITRLTQDKTKFERNIQTIDEHRARIAELQQKIGQELDYDALRKEEAEVSVKLRTLYEERAKVNKSISDYGVIARSGVCPLCGTAIPSEEYQSHLGELEGKLESIGKEIASAEKRERDLVGLMEQAKVQVALKKEIEKHEEAINRITANLVYEDFDAEIAEARQELERIRKLKDLLVIEDRLGRARSQYEKLSGELDELTRLVAELKAKSVELESALEELRPRLEQKEAELAEADKARREFIAQRYTLQTQVENLERLCEQRRKDLAKLEQAKVKKRLFDALQNYLAKSFIPALEQIETERLRWAKRELSSRTKEYFALLMQDDDRGVTVSEDYSPTLQRRIDGRWVDIPDPSGGERSAMALAFRLALSEVARARQGIQADFIMLDEPTDGFSEDQLTKFQSLLERLDIPQIILVTHHRSFEALGSNIVLVEYSENGSVVRRAGS